MALWYARFAESVLGITRRASREQVAPTLFQSSEHIKIVHTSLSLFCDQAEQQASSECGLRPLAQRCRKGAAMEYAAARSRSNESYQYERVGCRSIAPYSFGAANNSRTRNFLDLS